MPHPYEARILHVIDHIHANPAGDLSLDALAEVAAMSRFHWHRVFRALTGETLAQTVRRLRLHRAAWELTRVCDDIAALARQVGYADAASLTRAFAESYGVPPGAFRDRPHPFTPKAPMIKGVSLMSTVDIRTDPARTLAAMPHRGPYPQINHAFEKLSALMATRGLFAHARGMVAVFYDDPDTTDAAALRSHAGFVMDGAPALTAPLETIVLPAGRHAVLVHKGPYSGLPAAYNQLYAGWLPTSGEEPADAPTFECYLNSPMDTAQDDLLTEICVPLK